MGCTAEIRCLQELRVSNYSLHSQMSPLARTLVIAISDMHFGKLLTEWVFSRMPGAAKSLRSSTLRIGGSVLRGQRRNEFEYPNDKGSFSLCVYKLDFIFQVGM